MPRKPAKSSKPFTFLLKLDGRMPKDVTMKNLGKYISLFAELIGTENKPQFVKVIAASVGLAALVPHDRQAPARHRICRSRQEPRGRTSTLLRDIEAQMGEDGFRGATVETQEGFALLRLAPTVAPVNEGIVVYQAGTIDGEVTGILGSDDSMTLHLRDADRRDIRLMINNVSMAKRILPYWRTGTVRVAVHGNWARTDVGWLPDKTCVVDDFDPLDDTPLSHVLQAIADVPGNGWEDVEDPMNTWEELRGIS